MTDLAPTRPTAEELLTIATDQARFDGRTPARKMHGADVAFYITELLALRKEKVARDVLLQLPSEREALARIICTETNDNGCREIMALRAAGWSVETAIDDQSVSIVAYRNKPSKKVGEHGNT